MIVRAQLFGRPETAHAFSAVSECVACVFVHRVGVKSKNAVFFVEVYIREAGLANAPIRRVQQTDDEGSIFVCRPVTADEARAEIESERLRT